MAPNTQDREILQRQRLSKKTMSNRTAEMLQRGRILLVSYLANLSFAGRDNIEAQFF